MLLNGITKNINGDWTTSYTAHSFLAPAITIWYGFEIIYIGPILVKSLKDFWRLLRLLKLKNHAESVNIEDSQGNRKHMLRVLYEITILMY